MPNELIMAVEGVLEPGSYAVEPSSAPYFRRLERAFPIFGSKIDWSKVPGAIDRDFPNLDYEEYCEQALRLLKDVVETAGVQWTDEVVVVVDADDDRAVLLTLAQLAAALPSILATWQHTYVIGKETTWCLVSTMEGSLAFGRAVFSLPESAA